MKYGVDGMVTSQGHNAAIVAGKDTDGLSVQSGMENLLNGTEETVAID